MMSAGLQTPLSDSPDSPDSPDNQDAGWETFEDIQGIRAFAPPSAEELLASLGHIILPFVSRSSHEMIQKMLKMPLQLRVKQLSL